MKNGERSCSTKTNRGCRSTTRFNFNFSIQLDRHCSSLIRRKGDTNTTEALKKLALHVVGIHDRRDVLTKIVGLSTIVVMLAYYYDLPSPKSRRRKQKKHICTCCAEQPYLDAEDVTPNYCETRKGQQQRTRKMQLHKFLTVLRKWKCGLQDAPKMSCEARKVALRLVPSQTQH